jgi:hypothetical protein
MKISMAIRTARKGAKDLEEIADVEEQDGRLAQPLVEDPDDIRHAPDNDQGHEHRQYPDAGPNEEMQVADHGIFVCLGQFLVDDFAMRI